MQSGSLSFSISGVSVSLAYLRREGTRPPLVCLHGFGSTKEDYADLALRTDFAGRDLIFMDAPGFGASEVGDPQVLTIPFLVDVAVAGCDRLGLERFHLSGHSMGGLTALMLAHSHPDRVLSLIDIEGNVAPEDCFLSRQIIEHPAATPEAFFEGFISRVRERAEFSSALYIAGLPAKVRVSTIGPVFASMVDLSDNTPLMDILACLGCPRVFIHGEQNRQLSYLGELPAMGVEVCEIPQSAHFPMYSNPPALWSAMADFLNRAEAQ